MDYNLEEIIEEIEFDFSCINQYGVDGNLEEVGKRMYWLEQHFEILKELLKQK